MLLFGMIQSKSRERWRSRLGFIISSVGSAVGLGNVWRFPTMMTRGGGGTFLSVYIIACVFIGVPIMIAELRIGRRTQRNVVDAYS